MKIKKVIDICKGTGRISLYDGKNEQWISDGYACYPLYGMPKLDKETLCSTYDIAETQAEKIHFQHDKGLPEFIEECDRRAFIGSKPVSQGQIRLIFNNRTLIPFILAYSIAFVDEKYFQPFMDIDGDLINVYEYVYEGIKVFAVYSGMVLIGIIGAYDVVKNRFVNQLGEIYSRCRLELDRTKNDDGQQSFIEEN